MRREDPKTITTSLLAGVAIALTLAIILRPSYLREQAERQAIETEWVREQRAKDRAYEAEVKAEQLRWEQLETERQNVAEIVEVVTDYNDPRIPDEVEEAARKWGEVYQISPELLMTMAWRESRFNPEANGSGCIGLMQIAPQWHKDRLRRLNLEKDDLLTVDGNMAVAADYLHELFEKNEDDVWVLMTYNGDGRADAYLEGRAPASSYATEILKKSAELTAAHEGGESLHWLEE